jgi:hypothetical protein
MCPACGKQNVFPGEYDCEHRECHSCGWEGHMDDLKSHEFWIERVAHIRIDYSAIDEIVYNYYGNNKQGQSGRPRPPAFEMVCNGEWCNDSSHQFDVSPVTDAYVKEDAMKFRKDGDPRGLSNSDVLNILCEDGWLERGRYLVEVCW